MSRPATARSAIPADRMLELELIGSDNLGLVCHDCRATSLVHILWYRVFRKELEPFVPTGHQNRQTFLLYLYLGLYP